MGRRPAAARRPAVQRSGANGRDRDRRPDLTGGQLVANPVAYKAAYAPIAGRVIEVDTPGLTGIDPGRFHYQRAVRANRLEIG
jgi:hypothetical protein